MFIILFGQKQRTNRDKYPEPAYRDKYSEPAYRDEYPEPDLLKRTKLHARTWLT